MYLINRDVAQVESDVLFGSCSDNGVSSSNDCQVSGRIKRRVVERGEYSGRTSATAPASLPAAWHRARAEAAAAWDDSGLVWLPGQCSSCLRRPVVSQGIDCKNAVLLLTK